jgi:hypothetical protein
MASRVIKPTPLLIALNIKTPKKKGKKFKIDINFSTIYDINSTAIVVQTININKHKICIYM